MEAFLRNLSRVIKQQRRNNGEKGKRNSINHSAKNKESRVKT